MLAVVHVDVVRLETIVDIAGQPRWLCAMELDRSLWLFGSHDLFPCTEQGGADAFAQAIIDQLRHQARLL